MGSMLHLAVGRLEIDWGKNSFFQDYSSFFQGEKDVSNVPYYYVSDEPSTGQKNKDDWDLIIENKEGLSKPLEQVIDRINLLGHTFERCEQEFVHLSHLNDFDPGKFTFSKLRHAFEKVDVELLSANYGEGGEDFGKFFRQELAPRLGLEDELKPSGYCAFSYSEGMENLSAFSILQLLSKNSSTSQLPVQWAFSDIEEGGWAQRDDFVRELDRRNRFLLVTEGSSDAKIISQAFNMLRPHIADFFEFVDMEDGYPFSGTGNVFNFVKGLIGIGVQNNVLVIFDNDTEGLLNYERCQSLNFPDNMKILLLPDREKLRRFPTVGPTGEQYADVNKRGAAIECYLDLPNSAKVRWTGFNKKLDQYQGELEQKTIYMRDFLNQKRLDKSYDYSGLQSILDLVVDSAIEIKSLEQEADLKRNIDYRD